MSGCLGDWEAGRRMVTWRVAGCKSRLFWLQGMKARLIGKGVGSGCEATTSTSQNALTFRPHEGNWSRMMALLPSLEELGLHPPASGALSPLPAASGSFFLQIFIKCDFCAYLHLDNISGKQSYCLHGAHSLVGRVACEVAIHAVGTTEQG